MKKVAFFICLLFGFLLLFQLNTYAMENNSEKIEKIKKF